MTTPADPPGERPPSGPHLPSLVYLLMGPRLFWPALLEKTRRLPEDRLRRSEARVLLCGLMSCIAAVTFVPDMVDDLRTRWAWQPMPATIVNAERVVQARKDTTCFRLRLDVEASGSAVPTVTTTSHPHCLRGSWSSPPRQPQPGERITVRADPADLSRVIPDSALLNLGQYVAIVFVTILGIIPTALALIGHRAARQVLRERAGRA